jgi:hypothetical protein
VLHARCRHAVDSVLSYPEESKETPVRSGRFDPNRPAEEPDLRAIDGQAIRQSKATDRRISGIPRLRRLTQGDAAAHGQISAAEFLSRRRYRCWRSVTYQSTCPRTRYLASSLRFRAAEVDVSVGVGHVSLGVASHVWRV